MEKEEVDVPELSKIPIGATVSVITAIKFRYEGTVTAVNSLENTITLQNVHFWGTKDKNNETVSTQNTEVKGPTIGTHFDSITFWMSNVIKLTIELTSEAKNEIGDTAVKTSSTAETIKTPIKRPVVSNYCLLCLNTLPCVISLYIFFDCRPRMSIANRQVAIQILKFITNADTIGDHDHMLTISVAEIRERHANK